MRKTPVLNQPMRDAVSHALSVLAERKLAKRWDQAIHCVAIAYAAHEFFSDPDKLESDTAEKEFAETYSEHGFLANCSQFAQVLDALPDTDACHVNREARASKLSVLYQ